MNVFVYCFVVVVVGDVGEGWIDVFDGVVWFLC